MDNWYLVVGAIALMGFFIGRKLLLQKNANNIPINEVSHIDFSKPTHVLLDVRTPQEYKSGHIPHAKNINVSGGDFTQKISGLDKNKNYYIYCKSGMRSLNAYGKMKKAGFENITNLAGGIMQYSGKLKK